MSFVVGEVELSPTTIGKLAANARSYATSPGSRYVLLDSVRDATFLNKSSRDALGNNISDMGLGVVDNALFLYTTKFSTSDPSKPRQYPVKFFWIGSQSGTNDRTDTFSIFVADVNKATFYPGATAGEWLVNPRLVLSIQQAKNDVVGWFDRNYPGGASSGKGIANSGSNNSYGPLRGGSYDPGDISKMDSIDGQFWPIYDYVDNTILLYFSIKTPNANTLSIYCYKIKDSEMPSPVTSSEFVGGIAGSFVLSSHRFSMVSPDPLLTQPPVKGQQSAIVAYTFGTFDGSTPDHARYMIAGYLVDIHGSPLNWNGNLKYSWNPNEKIPQPAGLDAAGLYNVDKLGAITPIAQGQHGAASYSILYNATTDRDIRAASNNVVISAMQIRVAYIHIDPITNVAFGDCIKQPSETETVGHCRPQFTSLPDGIPKLLYADFNFDQSLRLSYEYIDEAKLRPENQTTLVVANDVMPHLLVVPSYGKRKATVVIGAQNQTGEAILPTNKSSSLPTAIQLSEFHGNVDASTGYQRQNYYDDGSLVLLNEDTIYSFINEINTELKVGSFTIEDPPPYFRLDIIGSNINSTSFFEVIKLE